MNFYKQPWVWIIVFSVIFSGAIIYFGEEVVLFSEEEKVIAVNDEIIGQSEFGMIIKQVEQNYSEMMGMSDTDYSKEEVRETAIEMAVDQLLLISYAKELGLTSSEKEIDDFYEEIIGHEPEISTKAQLFDAWEAEGFDKKEMERQVSIYLLYDNIYDFYTSNTEATDDELQEAYEEYITWIKEIDASGEEVMSFDEIKRELEEFIIQEKAIEKMEVDIEDFREKSEIKVLI